MPGRTPRTTEPDESIQEAQDIAPAKALVESLESAFVGLHLHLDKVDAQIESLRMEVHGPYHKPIENDVALPKVQRRRSLDGMEFALKRLMSPDPRPADDDSPQVLQDAIAEVIVLRQLTQDLMQILTNGYQHGLVTIRDMTNR